ncbi:serine/threonine-protein kinase BSK3-like [Papaver somniferum]|uniref:serine/threonine-protein kinase BSK3-like n=1 Tax=Papaver somniferum TaxID=3469 RepID=UPI000E6F960E|nr:serine/threonine-protein kinase BSK3-like [Papaver somniferum]
MIVKGLREQTRKSHARECSFGTLLLDILSGKHISPSHPLSDPDEHGADPKTKKIKKKKASDMNNRELKLQRTSKETKTAS